MQKDKQEKSRKKKYKRGHSTHKGFFISMKLTIDLEYPTLKPLAFLINEANIPEAKIYLVILE